jgi:hypothetical protein
MPHTTTARIDYRAQRLHLEKWLATLRHAKEARGIQLLLLLLTSIKKCEDQQK